MLAKWPGSDIGKRRFEAVAMALALKDPALKECTDASKLIALNQCCMLGLIPDKVLGHIWMVPFRNKGQQEVQIIPGYKGLIELARRSGIVTRVETGFVHTNDQFVFQQGTQSILRHVPWWQLGNETPGHAVCVWGLAEVKGSTVPHIDAMHMSEIEAVRQRARAKSGPWVTDFEMMARKTVIRRMSKLWSLSPELAVMQTLDNHVHEGTPQFRTMGADSGAQELEGEAALQQEDTSGFGFQGGEVPAESEGAVETVREAEEVGG